MRLSWLLPPIRDNAFKWVSESWKETQTLEALRKVAPFATLDAKLLSALTNIFRGTLLERLIPSKKLKPLQGGLLEEDKFFSCSMITSVHISSMEPLMHSRICSACSYAVKT